MTDALDETEMERVIADAVEQAARRGIAGKAVTPFLLARINEITAGRSLKANIALVRNNVAVAARTAVAYAAQGRA